MSRITDDMLNDYIDNELNSSSIDELKNNLNNDSEALNKLKALKIIDESLREMEVYPAPSNFTEKVMNSVLTHAKSLKPKLSYFFVSIVSIFFLTIVGISVFVINIAGKTKSTGKDLQIVESVKKFIGENSGSVNSFLSNDKIVLVGGLLTIILFLAGIFVLDSHKSFKNKLKSVTH